MQKERVEKVLKKMKEMQLSQLFIYDPMSIFYLTGRFLDPGERLWALYLREDGKHLIFINKLFTVEEDLGVEKVWFSDTDSVMDIVSSKMDYATTLGVDKDLPARFLLPLMEKKAANSFVNASIIIDETRESKDQEEIEKMFAVSKINDLAMEKFKEIIVAGATEEDLANQMLDIYKSLGADDYSFEPLVAFGPNGAEGHHGPDQTVLKPGDSVLLDVGCKKDMYCADMTRTFFFESVSDEHKKVYETVKLANETAIAMIKPGVPLKDIDKAARNVIENAGFGEYFTHRLGHFIGLSVHEYGDVSGTNEKLARPGMIFSIEPGIYLPGDVGVRIEDLVCVTEDGCEKLNHYDKSLQIVNVK